MMRICNFFDWNRDGKTDLLFYKPSGAVYYKPWNGSSFGFEQTTGLNVRHITDGSSVFLDINGDGLSDWLNIYKISARVHLSNDSLIKDNVIARIDNGAGALTEITLQTAHRCQCLYKGQWRQSDGVWQSLCSV
ncbi:MAG: FG-GAP-like repeat-containing protein [Enterobacterales bacterium]|nr:FG-GAP-like repeat-containing protein [Enterobacterales bacterium]